MLCHPICNQLYQRDSLENLISTRLIFRKRATNYRALSRKMTFEDKASYGSSPPCINETRWKIWCQRKLISRKAHMNERWFQRNLLMRVPWLLGCHNGIWGFGINRFLTLPSELAAYSVWRHSLGISHSYGISQSYWFRSFYMCDTHPHTCTHSPTPTPIPIPSHKHTHTHPHPHIHTHSHSHSHMHIQTPTPTPTPTPTHPHLGGNQLCPTIGHLTSWLSHFTHMIMYIYIYICIYIWSHVTHINTSCCTHEWVMLQIWMGDIAHINATTEGSMEWQWLAGSLKL